MASFQIVSDLHLESPSAYDVFELSPQAPYLALLGDIGNVKDDGLFYFLETQLRQFRTVFFLLGNHEPYHSDWTTATQRIAAFAESIDSQRAREAEQVAERPQERDQQSQAQAQALRPLGHFVFLDRTRHDVSASVTVLGCTFFSRITESQKMQVSFGLNDFFHINGWTVEQHTEHHEADRAWLNAQVSQITAQEPHRSIVVFTHHSPTVAQEAVDPAHRTSPLSSGFATPVVEEGDVCWEAKQVKFWAFGHTHYNCDFTDKRTGKRVVANQRGYYFAQAQVFNPYLVVEV